MVETRGYILIYIYILIYLTWLGFEKRMKLLWPYDLVRAFLKSQGLLESLSQQCPTTYWQWSKKDKPWTGDRVLGPQGSSMHKENTGHPVWHEQKGGLWHKSQKVLFMVMGRKCHTLLQLYGHPVICNFTHLFPSLPQPWANRSW